MKMLSIWALYFQNQINCAKITITFKPLVLFLKFIAKNGAKQHMRSLHINFGGIEKSLWVGAQKYDREDVKKKLGGVKKYGEVYSFFLFFWFI